MKKIITYTIFSLVIFWSLSSLGVEISTNFDSGMCKINDTVEFYVQGEPPEKDISKFNYTMYIDGEDKQKGLINLGESIKVTPKKSGFILFSINYKDSQGKVKYFRKSIGVDIDKITQSEAKPADFANFWRDRKAELAKVPLKAQEKQVYYKNKDYNDIVIFDVKVDCIDGVPVSGYLTMPANAKEKSLPALVNFHGAGVRSSAMPLAEAKRNILAFDVNAHGILNGQAASYYNDLDKTVLADYRRKNADNRDKIYYKNMFLRTFRALEYIKSRPEWDGRILIVSGGSQGGAQAIVAAALDNDVTCCVAMVPALSDHHGILHNRMSSWPYFIQRKNGIPISEAIVEAVKYFDVANFASEINSQTECFFSLGFLDTTCPPSSVCAAFNALKTTQKTLYLAQKQGHTLTPDVFSLSDKFIDAHIVKMKNKLTESEIKK